MKGKPMQARDSITSERLSGETTAAVLYWGAWCLIGLSVFLVIAISISWDYPTTLTVWQIALHQIRQVIYIVWAAFVLFGISALIRTVSVNSLEMRERATNENNG